MAYDVVRPLKLESSARGGVQNDYAPKELDACQDAIPMAALLLQDTSTTAVDQKVAAYRTGQALNLTDASATRTLGELVSKTLGQSSAHQGLLDVIHFLEDGPGDGWASGAVCVDNYTGLLRTSSTWYQDASQAKRIVARIWTYQGLLVATDKTTIFAADGVTALRTITDTFTYSGALRTSRTRTWG